MEQWQIEIIILANDIGNSKTGNPDVNKARESEIKRLAGIAAAELAAQAAAIEAARELVEYRRRAGPLNFQLEKADDFINAIAAALEGGE